MPPLRRLALLTLAALALAGASPATAEDAPKQAERPTMQLLNAPVVPVPPLLTQDDIDRATDALDGIVTEAMQRTGLPGLAVGVVYKDKVIYAESFGVREIGKPGKIDADTVFLLASVSKPIASTIVAKLVGEGKLDWTDTAKSHNPAFALSDPYVTEHATIADLLSHRSGLHTGAGDLLEDLGFGRNYILSHIDQQPLDPFRVTYRYSNFGYTAGGIAAAEAAGMSWEDLAETALFEPAGMATASYRHSDYLSHEDRAHIHARTEDGGWAALYDRNADAEAPAGGASASLNDMLRFLRLQLGQGTLDGTEIVSADALAAPHVPQVIPGPPSSPAARAGFYGFGWNISYDDEGRARIGHSGAFELGTATNITFLPGEDLGIVVLTNGMPIGVAEAISAAFLDVAQNGHQTVDWVGFLGGIFDHMRQAEAPEVDYSKTPAEPKPAQKLAAYTGSYGNGYYGPLTIAEKDGALAMTLGPQGSPTTFALTHFDGDTFSFQTIGENANGLAGAIFQLGADGKAEKVVLDYYDRTGLGSFVRE
ncbi:serine hydrolase [Methyloligella sp. 2.7D]|uniref:serine hydrolase n=1 Tax=unclassified Methyloligella TaxID=2625955 RepID=UPI00157CA582|nr:serine hydrolase [Methyloligella sp. GL2]QKP76858.1 serine hydrolase [Methyloligella sp. GL2]